MGGFIADSSTARILTRREAAQATAQRQGQLAEHPTHPPLELVDSSRTQVCNDVRSVSKDVTLLATAMARG